MSIKKSIIDQMYKKIPMKRVINRALDPNQIS